MNSTIINNLEKIKLANSLNNREMADIMGITRQTYGKISNGRDIRWDEMANLRLKLSVDLNKLVLDEYRFTKVDENNKNTNELNVLFQDFINYGLSANKIREAILLEIFKKFLKEKSLYEKHIIGRDNRSMVELSKILWFLSSSKYTPKNQSKLYLSNIIKKQKITNFSKKVKKNLIERIETMSEKDCFYMIDNPKLAAKVLISFFDKSDKRTLNLFGFKEILEEIINYKIL